MYNRPSLSLAQVQAAMNAMIAHASQKPDAPVTMAIVDDAGEIIGYAKMDNCRKLPQRMAFKKAYTAALRGADSRVFVEQLKEQGVGAGDFGDPNLVGLTGGVVIRLPNSGPILGGIGVSGLPSADADEAISRIGLEAMKL